MRKPTLDLLTHHTVKDFNLIATTLIIASMIYLIGANWFGLSPNIRLMIPMALMSIAAIISIFILNNHKIPHQTLIANTLQTISGIMIGLSMAVIGQIYQTGADAYSLFIAWAILLLLWLYRHNSGIYWLWIIVSQLALYLYFNQTPFGNDSIGYLLSVQFLTAIQFIIAIYYYPSSQLILSPIIAMIGGYYAMEFIGYSYNKNLPNFLSIFLLPVLSIFYYYRQNFNSNHHSIINQLSMAIISIGIGISTFILLLDLIGIDFNGFGTILFYGILAILLFFAIGFGLLKLFPKGIFHYLPIVFGAWLGGLLISAAFLIFWESVSLFFGLIGFIVAIGLLNSQSHLFVRQLAYAILIASQTAFLIHLGIEFDLPLLGAFIIQFIFTVICAFIKPHWFLMSIQLLASYILLCLATVSNMGYRFENTGNLNVAYSVVQSLCLLIVPLLLLYHHRLNEIMDKFYKTILSLIIGMIAAGQIINENYLKIYQFDDTPIVYFSLLGIDYVNLIKIIEVCYVFIVLFLLKNQFAKTHLILLGILGIALSVLGYNELFVLILALLWTNAYQERWFHYLYLFGIGLFLWYLYYRLDMLFLTKSLTIFISGILFFVLAYVIKLLNKENHNVSLD